jgi:SAM-dependent MidA family methyltransferase
MELELNEPDHGYYATSANRIGEQGDFVTASDAGPAFGRCLARQIAEFDAVLGCPEPFVLVELGAGRGLLARHCLDATRALGEGPGERLRLRLVDRSAAMRAEAARRVPEATVAASAEPDDASHGCVVAVELFDALPVHRVRRHEGLLLEVFVDVDARGRLVEREARPGDEVRALVERYGAVRGDGEEAEVSTGLASALAEMAAAVGRGFLLIVDYGASAERLQGARHRRGTLLAYHRHRTSEDYLLRVGRQDLTAHVNFTALEDAAGRLGLQVVGRTTQDRFLLANGLVELFESSDARRPPGARTIQQRRLAMQLIHPHAMGRRFQVLVLCKGLEHPPALRGLRDPFR